MKKGVKVHNKRKVRIGDLHFQTCPLAYNPDLWNGDVTGGISNSPHVDFILLYQKHGKGILKLFSETRYYRMYCYWDSIKYGSATPPRSKKYMVTKANKLMNTFDSIAKKGFNKKNAISVLDEPLWVSRGFAGGDHLKGPEVFHGHHRAACMFVLGIKMTRADLCKDMQKKSLLWVQQLSRMKQ